MSKSKKNKTKKNKIKKEKQKSNKSIKKEKLVEVKVDPMEIYTVLDKVSREMNKNKNRSLILDGQLIYPGEIDALLAIQENQPISFNQLIALLGMTRSAVLKNVNKLNNKGFIKKQKSSKNDREQEIVLTRQGEEIAKLGNTWKNEKILPVLSAIESLKSKDSKILKKSLDKILLELINK